VPLQVLAADLGAGVLAGFTTRAGGVSVGDYDGLDLALHVGDDPSLVRRNRDLVQQWAGAAVQFVRQVHGSVVVIAAAGGPVEPEPEGDAVLSAAPSVAAGVLVADCVPILLADPRAGAVAAVHAGRVGLVGGVVEASVAAMVRAGARPDRIVAALGPAAGACCYEVGDQVRAEVSAAVPQTWAITRWGTASVDLRAGCAAVLAGLGVSRVSAVGGCTIEDETWYSHRRATTADRPCRTGRFAGVVRLLP
jgi:YfiH family protein